MAEFEYDAGEEKNEDDDEEGGSWFFGGRTASIFLIDASEDMFQASSEANEDPSFMRAVKCIHSTLRNKVITSDQDMVSVVLFNTREMKNATDFSHIYVLQELDRPGAEKILELEELMNMSVKNFDKKFGNSNNANIHDALRVCQGIFTKCSSKLAGQSILLFTCRDDPHHGDNQKQRQAVQKAKDLREVSISLEVLHMGENFDVKKFYKDLIVLDDDERESQEQITLANPTSRFEELMERVTRLDHKQRTTGRVTFSLAPGVEMSVAVYTAVRKMYKPYKVKLRKVTNEEVRYMRKEYLEETGELLVPSDYVKYQEYGGKKIKFTLDELRSLKSVYQPGIVLLGFKPIEYIKPYFHVKPANFIYADEKSVQGSNKMFAALLDRCLERKVAPIVRLIARKNSSVSWAALIPQSEEVDENNSQISPPGFHACHLPFADDFRNIQMENMTRATTDQVDAAKAVIKKLRFKYSPLSFPNPDLETHWNNIEALALNRDSREPVEDFTAPDYEQMAKQVGHRIDNLRDMVYPPSYDPAQPPKKRPATSSAPAPKKAKPDPKSINVEEMAKAGTVNKLTMDVLKAWLQERGIKISGKKKDQLVQDVMDEVGA
ncbi:X-ray repair cross-complementing protein 6 [Halocaridina rubra]|uniref:ATP-dependent DNA helicase 2 subunit 1 n=1 Tax=Halocaridina rubra TaxID=373956 RepID=A0AAN8ZTQ5_HALRR